MAKYIKYIIIIIIYLSLLKLKKNKNYFISTPKISVFLPIYNKAHYLNRSIGSIINQNLKNIEIIAVNDGSTDNTLKTLKKLSKKDSRIKITNNDRNLGLLYSRAMGILNSSGKYIMDLDPDDKLEGNSNLENLYNMTIKNNFDLINLFQEIIHKFWKNNILNKISDNKVIIFFDSKNITLNQILMIKGFLKKLKQKNIKKIVAININTNLKKDIIFNYIYNNDIIIGLDNIIFNKNFEMIIKKYSKNKFIIFSKKKNNKLNKNYIIIRNYNYSNFTSKY